MIKKYNDNYIDLDAVIVVTAISDTYYDGLNERYMFQAVLSGGASIGFKDNDKERLQALRDRIVKDWMEAKGAIHSRLNLRHLLRCLLPNPQPHAR